jgi:hypothetical protein
LLELWLLGVKRQISYIDSHWHNPLKGWRRGLDDFWSVQGTRVTQAEQTGGIQRERRLSVTHCRFTKRNAAG